MEKDNSELERQTSSLVKTEEEMGLEQTQMAEQLYNSAGLDPVVDAGLADYDRCLQQENKFINKVFGIRGSDIRGYGKAVARRVAFATYTLMNRQYGGKMGDLKTYIKNLEDDRERANARYDELMGRVVGILGDEYKDLRSDSREFMEKLTQVLGNDLEESRIDKKELAEKLADIEGLRSKINDLKKEKEKAKDEYESELASLKSEHKEEVTGLNLKMASLQSEHKEEIAGLRSEIAGLNTKLEGLAEEKKNMTDNLKRVEGDYSNLKVQLNELMNSLPNEEMQKSLADELYSYILKDANVPDTVIKGVGKFIDFRKYLGLAIERGSKEVKNRIGEIVENAA